MNWLVSFCHWRGAVEKDHLHLLSLFMEYIIIIIIIKRSDDGVRSLVRTRKRGGARRLQYGWIQTLWQPNSRCCCTRPAAFQTSRSAKTGQCTFCRSRCWSNTLPLWWNRGCTFWLQIEPSLTYWHMRRFCKIVSLWYTKIKEMQCKKACAWQKKKCTEIQYYFGGHGCERPACVQMCMPCVRIFIWLDTIVAIYSISPTKYINYLKKVNYKSSKYIAIECCRMEFNLHACKTNPIPSPVNSAALPSS